MTTIHETPTFEDELESFSEKIFESALGALELPIISMGRNLGLYEALRGEGGLTAAALGTRAGVDSRYAREWLEHQAVSGIVTVDDPARPAEDRRYTLPETHAIALLDEEHSAFAAIYLAERYPNVRVDGFDLDDASIALARQHAAGRGLADRVSFELCDITDADMPGPYDLVMCCEVIHDLPDPVGALAAMRRVVAENGEVLVIDERASDHFDTSGDPIERFLYAISILHCLPVGREAESSVATGTVMRPDTFRAYATEAGFADVDELPIEHLMFRFYRPAR
ncbi:MAG: SAM-dependent methyltransferase [Acidimicrobiia bacterium]